jgi:hypothetical protein
MKLFKSRSSRKIDGGVADAIRPTRRNLFKAAALGALFAGASGFQAAAEIQKYSDFITAKRGEVARQLSEWFADRVNVLSYIPHHIHDAIAAKTSTADVSAYLAQAVAESGASGRSIYAPAGLYLCQQQWAIALLANMAIVGEDKDATIIKFALTGHNDNCVQVSNAQFYRLTFHNLTLDFDATGLDGISMDRGVPQFDNVNIKNSHRDAHTFPLVGTSSGWIENAFFRQVEWDAIGRHIMNVDFSSSSRAVPFFNESLFDHCECRGIGVRFAGSNILHIAFDGTSSAISFANIIFEDCNFDVEVANSVGGSGVGDAIKAVSLNGGQGTVYNIFVRGGAWESTAGSNTRAKTIVADAGITVSSFNDYGYTRAQWVQAASDDILNLESTYQNRPGQLILPTLAARPNGIGLKGAGLITGFANTPTLFAQTKTASARSTVTFDIPIETLTNFSAQGAIAVLLSKQGLVSSSTFDQLGLYLVHCARDSTKNYAKGQQVFKLANNVSYGFDPDIGVGVVFSMVDASTLRVRITTGANVGTDGSATQIYCTASRGLILGVGSAGDVINMPI